MMYNLIRILGNRSAGFILGMLVVLNLIAGSLVMNGHPDLYPSFFNLDLNYFFQPVRGEHIWLYALLVTFSLLGVNLLACTVESVIRLINIKTGRLRASAALLFHVALLTTMVAHLFEGFYASTQRSIITAQGTELPVLGKVRVESLKNIHYPDGSLKDTEVKLIFNMPDGQQAEKEIAFNQPAVFDSGRRQVVMLSGQVAPGGVVISRDIDNREFRLETGQSQSMEGGNLILQGLFENNAGVPFAQFLWQAGDGRQQQLYMVLGSGQMAHTQINVGGVTYRFKKIIETPIVVAIVRHNPAIPLVVVSLILASVATLLLIGWLRGRNETQNLKGLG